jgi:hypothetical protein
VAPRVDAGTDTGGAVDDAGDSSDAREPDAPEPTEVLPAFDAATEAHVRDLVARGRARGNRHDVVAKIGDSITESASFLMDCGSGWYRLGEHPEVEPTIRYFAARMFDDGRNSLNRASLCATAGWTSGDALQGDPDSPLARELEASRPQWAIVMYGTNDLERSDVASYRANMARIVDVIEARDVVAVLSTIPPRMDGEPYASRVASFNDVVRGLARARHLPLIDYWLALEPIDGPASSRAAPVAPSARRPCATATTYATSPRCRCWPA